ncbi:MAG: ABC transporter [Proteobacteria bacterium]|nr:ABC transporter [Pseudomonadota bacterium]
MTSAIRVLALGLMLSAISLVAGCTLSATGAQAQTTYRLLAVPLVVSAANVRPVVIRLLAVGAAPGLGGTAMLYSAQPGQIEPYRDSRWVAPPADLIRAAIAQTLSRQSWVSAVEQATPLAPADWTLHCDLVRLDHDVFAGHGVVHLDLTCQIVQASPRRVFAHWHVDGQQVLAVNDALHYAQAAQSLLQRAVAQIVTEVARAAGHDVAS